MDSNSKGLFKSLIKNTKIYEEKPTKTTGLDVPEKVNDNNPKVFLDITIGNGEKQRVEFELFEDVVPKTVENFRNICSNENGFGYTYKNSVFHKLIKNSLLQGGDFENGNGTGGASIYGRTFNDENFIYNHSGPGLLTMANTGKNTNNSQFWITLNKNPFLDGYHVVFGKVISGMEVIKEIAQCPVNQQNVLESTVKIVDCGELKYEVIY